MNKLPEGHVEYFRKTDKSFVTFKNMPEAYKLILNNMGKGELLTPFAIMCIYNQFKGEVEGVELRTKGIDEIYFELNDLYTRGFVERVIINDALWTKIKTFQALI